MRGLAEGAAESCRLERCGEAIERLEAALREEPTNPRLHERLGLCYSGGCRPHPYTSPEVAVCYLRHGLSLAGPAADAGMRARMLDTLGNTCARLRRFTDAVACHGEAAALYRKAGARDDWGREEFNLANAWCETGNWAEAIGCYHRALEVRTRERDPRRWAAVMENLGSACRGAGDYRGAVDCYRRAMRVYTARACPRQNAALHNNLGNAYLSMAGTRHTRRALRHLDRALEVRTRAASPGDFAITQFNRGHAFARLLMPERAATCFAEAAECFEAAGHAEKAELAGALRARAEAALRVIVPPCASS